MKALFLAFGLGALISLCGIASVQANSATNCATGGGHSLFFLPEGSLWGMGRNAEGEFGDGTTTGTYGPKRIESTGVIAVTCGLEHSLLLKSDGSLWGMGWNGEGELGDGTDGSNNYTNKAELIVPAGVVEVAAGEGHSLFRKSDGSLWATGWNLYEQLGDGFFEVDTNRPEQIVASSVVAIAAGAEHSLFVKSDGSLWAMGNNNVGQFGDGTYFRSATPEQIVASNVIAVAAGYWHSLFLESDGSLWAMGWNVYGQLGDGTAVPYTNSPERIVSSNVVAIAAGARHSLFLMTDGSLWAMGDNEYGQLGDGTSINTNKPQRIVRRNVVAVASGCVSVHSLFTKWDGRLWAWGYNGDGELGDGTTTDRHVPVPIWPMPPAPAIRDWHFSGTDVLVNAANGLADATYYLLMSSDASLPLGQWTSIATNVPDADGDFTITAPNAYDASAARRFYTLVLSR